MLDLVALALLDELPQPLPAALQAVLLLEQLAQADQVVDAPRPQATGRLRIGPNSSDWVIFQGADLLLEPVLPPEEKK